MNETPACLPTPINGQRVTVEIPDGLPALMMVVAREVMRHTPEDECTAYSIVAKYLEEMIQEDNEKVVSCIEDEITPEMITQTVIETVENYGVTPESANDAAIVIQRAWRKYNKSVSEIKPVSLGTVDHDLRSKETQMDCFEEEIDNESDMESIWKPSDIDDMERVNVVRKGQRDYVPPIPDFIDDLYSLKTEENLNDQPKEAFYEDEEYNYKSTDNELSRENIAQSVIKTDEKHVSSIQPDSLEMGDHISSKETLMENYEEMNFENDSDDMERVNVVRKGQRDYVPPIPDFIDDVNSLKYE